MGAGSGCFVTLEGGEGVGKSTQARHLATALRARGLDVVETREPGGSPGAEAIRGLLLGGDVDRWSARAEALLFAAARADHIERLIRPALARGAWVICDRFLDSSIAYQGAAGELGAEAVRTLHAIGSDGFLPDRTLLLTLPQSSAAARERERDGGRPDRFGQKHPAYHQSVVDAFLQLAEQEPARIRIVDASGSQEEVTQRLLAQLLELLPA